LQKIIKQEAISATQLLLPPLQIGAKFGELALLTRLQVCSSLKQEIRTKESTGNKSNHHSDSNIHRSSNPDLHLLKVEYAIIRDNVRHIH